MGKSLGWIPRCEVLFPPDLFVHNILILFVYMGLNHIPYY